MQAVMSLNDAVQSTRSDLRNLCNQIVEASLRWTGDDELKNPELRRLRLRAFEMLKKYEEI